MNIIFLHGWGMNRGIWIPFIECLKPLVPSNIKLSAINWFQYQTCTTNMVATDVLEALAVKTASQLKENTILVGWSMGGLIAQHIVNRGTNKVLGQIQICSSPKFGASQDWEGIQPNLLALFADQLSKDHEALLKRFLAIQCMGLDKPKEIHKLMLDSLSESSLPNKEQLEADLQILSEVDLRKQKISAAQNAIPSLRIFGSLDSLIPKNAIPKIADLYPADRIEVIKNAAHAPFISHKEECARLIVQHLHRWFLNLDSPN